MKNTKSFCAYLLLALLIYSCSAQKQTQQIIRIDGSNGVRPLVVALVKGFQEKYPDIQIDIGEGMNTKDRINALASGQIDLAMASHGIDEKKLSAQDIQIHKFAQMAIVLAVNQDVPIDNISDLQVCDIYSGTLNNWSELQGPDIAIVPLTRPNDEVDAEVLLVKSPCFAEVQLANTVQSFAKSGGLAKALAATSGAIGMTTMVRVAKSDGKMRALRLNDIDPSSANIQSGKYQLTRNSYLLTKGKASGAIRQLLEFIKSDEGAQLILSSSAVPI